MNIDRDITAKAELLRGLLRSKLGIRSRSLEQGLRRAGRRLPRRIRAKGAKVARAGLLAGNPHVARQINLAEVDAAFDEVQAHLKAVDVADRRKGQLLGWAGVVVFNLLVIATCFIFWLVWRGYV